MDCSTPRVALVPLSIADWKTAQAGGHGLQRLYKLVQEEHITNPETHAWISLATEEQLENQWIALEKRGSPDTLPLYGVPFAVKDNIDVDGFVTTAACPSFSSSPAASDAAVISNLKAAGAIVVGKTNLDQFATGLVGTRSPYGAVTNSFDPGRVSGGSSSGSAVVVARGRVPFSLGSDTAGSGRIPAGLNNILGLKPTRGALSARGALPACRTLDCISIFALTVDDIDLVLSLVEGYDSQDPYSRLRPDEGLGHKKGGFGSRACMSRPSLGICADPQWFGRDDHHPAYTKALEKAKSLGWRLTPVDFQPLLQLAQLLYSGPWVAERYHAIRSFIRSEPQSLDPVVRGIIQSAESFSASDAFEGEYLRQDLTRKIQTTLASFDGLLVPTSPTFPTMEQIAADPVRENSLLGTYTNFVNFLDWSALAIPAGYRPDGLPFGITLISDRWREPQLSSWAREWFSGQVRTLGATSVEITEPTVTSVSTIPGHVQVAVVGAHLSGFPLNKDLVSRQATIVRATKTSPHYRFFALESKLGPKKPGLRRVLSQEEGAAIELEVWNLPEISLASFMATIPSPLSLGKVELADGSWITGFLCEPYGLQSAIDITEYGGWRAYQATLDDDAAGSSSKAVSKVLIANRGEIALRIIETLHKMGLVAVAIYSDIDADSLHVRNADISLRLEGTSVSETYLNVQQIIRLAKSKSVDGVIPGYGFLSENAEFATAVQEAGMIWIGPTPEHMSVLGLKHRARDVAISANVPTVPGSKGLLTSLDHALDEAERIGFPLMLKSTAGGGGIGISQCSDGESLKKVFHDVQRQAAANFGDGGVFLERYVQKARHIEVQILGDGNGRVIVAGERDCSLQRRNQKVIEESPAAMVPWDVRDRMRAAAERLASSVKYLNVGTVEFIYDMDRQEFYFLEVNTRLQVEHPVTEQVTGLDLVECMIKVATGQADHLFTAGRESVPVSGASVEVRIYAESPLENFCPCSGRITKLRLPSTVRVDTWVEEGTNVTTSYDPMLAKLIAFGRDREEAIEKLSESLVLTTIEGVQTNLEYLRQIVTSRLFKGGNFTTKSMDTFQFISPSLEVLDPGALTTVQDFPGRPGYWSVGIPPSGPADNVSFRLANRLVDNPLDFAGLECTLQGPSLKFHCEAVIAVTGAEAQLELDGEHIASHRSHRVQPGQILRIGDFTTGYRVYLAIKGGIQVPMVFGSRSTFELGKMGGFNGRKLRARDIIPLQSPVSEPVSVARTATPAPIPSQPHAEWRIRAVPGPHGAPDHFTHDSVKELFSSPWKVHHNSNRLGVRLTGPRPEWARATGGEAGLHPSNIHDSPYSVGSVSFTGDEAVALTCDGPSLGGFVVFCVVASADLWKLGQARPGDTIYFHPIDVDEALGLEKQLRSAIESLGPLPEAGEHDSTILAEQVVNQPVVLARIEGSGYEMSVRQSGEQALMLLQDDRFNLRQNFITLAFCRHHEQKPIPGVEELTPGVCSLHVIFKAGISTATMIGRIKEHVDSYVVPSSLPSRTVYMPFAFDDAVSQAAVQRYTDTIRNEAPWLPSNVNFLQELNGIDDIKSLMHRARFIVIGLGDVFMGSPCAVPLDPRDRLFGTKYNPSRSFTPKGAVGIGGQYLCIYATDSPGGYQLVGRTKEIWDSDRVPSGPVLEDGNVPPWAFRLFDRIAFYPVTEEELDSRSFAELVRVEDGELDIAEYEALLDRDQEDIAAYKASQSRAIANVSFLDQLTQPFHPSRDASKMHAKEADTTGERVRAVIPGRCYKVNVKEGDVVKKGDILIYVESSKMEVGLESRTSGRCVAVLVEAGDMVEANDDLVILATA
ncbi:urea carboxylase [Geosmithia morbida]|uniref:Urea carboxylase n=1 Tax=Geosmithia morbida TaxID=1094350 RepID=A0A9P4YP98_9HYPO|nr:urea carboxylase [Geosmithia morbida]KAF4119545.1 urea carboxylase [Geosmithia morbida]